MAQDTQIVKKINTEFGKTIHYNLENLCEHVDSLDLTENEGYTLILKKQKGLVTGILSIYPSQDLRNFILLKRLYSYFGENISFNDFYEGIENGLKHSFKGNSGLDSRIDTSTSYPFINDSSNISQSLSPRRTLSKLGKRIIKLRNKKKETINTINKIDQYIKNAKEKLDSMNGLEENRQLEDCSHVYEKNLKSIGIRNRLSNRQKSLTGKIQKTEEELNKYFDFIHRRKGIHITAESKRENAYEIIANFYRQLLNPAKKQEDFDIEEAKKEIEEGWKEVKQLS